MKHPIKNHSFSIGLLAPLAVLIAALGCHSAKTAQKQNSYFTSGDPAADQRASQTMAQHEQLNSSAGSAGEQNGKGAGKGTNAAPEKTTLYQRLGGDQGLTAIVENFVPRVMDDPRVNWDRKGSSGGGLFHGGPSPAWSSSPEKVAQLKKHMVEFFSLTTGGPADYHGRDIKSSHAHMNISNAEFDAAIGDLKVSMDALKVPNNDQKELLAIVESTRSQIVTKR